MGQTCCGNFQLNLEYQRLYPKIDTRSPSIYSMLNKGHICFFVENEGSGSIDPTRPRPGPDQAPTFRPDPVLRCSDVVSTEQTGKRTNTARYRGLRGDCRVAFDQSHRLPNEASHATCATCVPYMGVTPSLSDVCFFPARLGGRSRPCGPKKTRRTTAFL